MNYFKKAHESLGRYKTPESVNNKINEFDIVMKTYIDKEINCSNCDRPCEDYGYNKEREMEYGWCNHCTIVTYANKIHRCFEDKT